MSACLHIKRLTGAASLQDGGRRGYLRFGLSASGPMDPLAFAAANGLVGNPADAAALELGELVQYDRATEHTLVERDRLTRVAREVEVWSKGRHHSILAALP